VVIAEDYLIGDGGSQAVMTALSRAQPTGLADQLSVALAMSDGATLEQVALADALGDRDRFSVLTIIYGLHTARLELLGETVRWQHHPAVAAIKQRMEREWLEELEAADRAEVDLADPLDTLRKLAARDRLPPVYKWIAKHASWDEVVSFLALEGGPDAGFDDLVAACQVGLSGAPKLELARNYWDEMGGGEPDYVHTALHDQLVAAIAMPHIPLSQQPLTGLARSCLGGLLATNRWLQPEMLGALGLIELQAGPRCSLVLQAFDRCAAPAAAYPFYETHARMDPHHGRDWLDKAITPLIAERPAHCAGRPVAFRYERRLLPGNRLDA
jgi:hypothetical protein